MDKLLFRTCIKPNCCWKNRLISSIAVSINNQVLIECVFPDFEFQIEIQIQWQFLLQAAACDGLVYSANLNGQNMGTEGYALPLFED